MKIARPVSPGQLPGPYLSSYDGNCGPITKAAIRAFQADHVFVAGNGLQSAPNPNATAGQVHPGDATWMQLLARLPEAIADLRVLPGGKTVYLAASGAELLSRLSAVSAMTFAPAFRAKVQACLQRMHQLYGIAVGVCPQGDRRSFQSQYALLAQGTGVTNAGPGESNHNFGMATDIGFAG